MISHHPEPRVNDSPWSIDQPPVFLFHAGYLITSGGSFPPRLAELYPTILWKKYQILIISSLMNMLNYIYKYLIGGLNNLVQRMRS